MSPALTDIEFFCAVLIAVQFIDLLLHDWLNRAQRSHSLHMLVAAG